MNIYEYNEYLGGGGRILIDSFGQRTCPEDCRKKLMYNMLWKSVKKLPTIRAQRLINIKKTHFEEAL